MLLQRSHEDIERCRTLGRGKGVKGHGRQLEDKAEDGTREAVDAVGGCQGPGGGCGGGGAVSSSVCM